MDNVEEIVTTSGRTGILFNFGIGSPVLRSQHQDWLDKSAAPWLKDVKTRRVALYGHASRSGSDAFNLELARARMRQVRARLVAQGVDPSQFEPDMAMGERAWEAAGVPDGTENAKHRAVHVLLRP
jgi:outer membrane protein OmpA-like peptidoglycan-associated protein